MRGGSPTSPPAGPSRFLQPRAAVPPEQPTSIRLSRDLRRDLRQAADAEKRTLSAQIVYILQQWVAWTKTQRGKK